MVYHDTGWEGVISCWTREPKLPLPQSIIPMRCCGTVLITEMPPRHHGPADNP